LLTICEHIIYFACMKRGMTNGIESPQRSQP